jgi:hypothetical protein
VKVQPIGKTPRYSPHDSGDDAILQVRGEFCWILRLHHFHCLLVQMVWDIFGHKVQPCHLMCAVECGISGMAVLQVKLKTAKYKVTNFQTQIQYFSMTYFDSIDTFTHYIYRNAIQLNLFHLQSDPNQQAIQPLDIECVT